MKKLLLFIVLVFVKDSYIISTELVESETKVSKDIKEDASLEEINAKFNKIKKEILNLDLKEQVDLAINLLNQLQILGFIKDIPVVDEQINEINKLIELTKRDLSKQYSSQIMQFRHDPEGLEESISEISRLIIYQKKQLKALKRKILKVFYEIIYNNLKDNAENVSEDLLNYISKRFPKGKLPDPLRIK